MTLQQAPRVNTFMEALLQLMADVLVHPEERERENLQAHVAKLNLSWGHSTPLTGMSVFTSNGLQVSVAPHQVQLKSTLWP